MRTMRIFLLYQAGNNLQHEFEINHLTWHCLPCNVTIACVHCGVKAETIYYAALLRSFFFHWDSRLTLQPGSIIWSDHPPHFPMFLPLFSLTCVQTWMWICWKCLWRHAASVPGCCRVIVMGTRARRGRRSPAGPGHPDAGLRGMCCGCPPLGRNWDGLTLLRCWCCGQMGRHRVPAEVGRYRVT